MKTENLDAVIADGAVYIPLKLADSDCDDCDLFDNKEGVCKLPYCGSCGNNIVFRLSQYLLTKSTTNKKTRKKMNVKELIEALSNYPDDMEVVLFRQESEDYEEFYDTDFFIETNDNNQLVID